MDNFNRCLIPNCHGLARDRDDIRPQEQVSSVIPTFQSRPVDAVQTNRKIGSLRPALSLILGRFAYYLVKSNFPSHATISSTVGLFPKDSLVAMLTEKYSFDLHFSGAEPLKVSEASLSPARIP